MEQFENINNQIIKKNVVSALPGSTLPEPIPSLLENWDSGTVTGENGKYKESFGGDDQPYCSKVDHYLCQNYRNVIKGKNYLQLIVDFLNVGDVLYALTIADIVLKVARKAQTIAKPMDVKTINGFISKLDELRYNIEHDADLFQNVNRNNETDNDLDIVRKEIYKELIYKIDGVTALTREIGTDTFIKYAIDQCYFFAPDIVVNRAEEWLKEFNNGEPIDARSSKNETIQNDKENGQMKFYDGSFSCRIDTNNDKNSPVRSKIKKQTGYTVSEGADCIFQNYIISHIWGRAFDPRYFTNLWNVVIVPSWANDLLDKPNPGLGTLESKLQSTIMKICEILYFNCLSQLHDNNQTLWDGLHMHKPQVLRVEDVVKPTKAVEGVEPKKTIPSERVPEGDVPYIINVIEGKKKGMKVGDIVKYAVYI